MFPSLFVAGLFFLMLIIFLSLMVLFSSSGIEED